MGDFEHIKFDRQGALATIELNRPDAANGLNAKMARELHEAAKICDREAEIKAVVLSASGRFFCAGGDLREMMSHGDAVGPAVRSLAEDLHAAVSLFARMQAALVVAVNGVAAGAGFSLALVGDIVLAAESSSFTMAYTRAGLCPDGSSSYFLPRLVGMRRAQELMLTNPTLSAQQALDIGLVTRVVADDDLRAEAAAVAGDFATSARLSTAFVKKLLLASSGNDLETQMALETQLIETCVTSPDGREGLKAFFEKRQPDFE